MNDDDFDLMNQFENGGCVMNAWLTIGDPYLVEIVVTNGHLFTVTLDMQHGLIDQRAAIECLRAANSVGGLVLVRLPKLDESLIGILLDAGVDGLILPQTNSAAEAEKFIAACHYPPRGTRSFGPTRNGLFPHQRVKSFVTFCMIETVDGLNAATEIAATDGLTGLFIGPGDLGISLGLGPGQDRSEKEFSEAVAKVKVAAKTQGIALGIHANSANYAAQKAVEGFQLITTWVDVVGIKQSLNESAATWKKVVGDRLREQQTQNKTPK